MLYIDLLYKIQCIHISARTRLVRVTSRQLQAGGQRTAGRRGRARARACSPHTTTLGAQFVKSPLCRNQNPATFPQLFVHKQNKEHKMQNKRAIRYSDTQRTLLIVPEICSVILSAAETSYVVSTRCIVRINSGELFLEYISFVL